MFNRSTVRRSWKAAALAVALPLMLAGPAAASAGQQAAGQAPEPQAVILSAPFDTSCGLLPPNCTIRLNRATTRNAGTVTGIVSGIASAACDPLDLPIVKNVCRGAILASAGAFAIAATEYYHDGDCLGIKVLVAPTPLAAPERVKHGQHNCS